MKLSRIIHKLLPFTGKKLVNDYIRCPHCTTLYALYAHASWDKLVAVECGTCTRTFNGIENKSNPQGKITLPKKINPFLPRLSRLKRKKLPVAPKEAEPVIGQHIEEQQVTQQEAQTQQEPWLGAIEQQEISSIQSLEITENSEITHEQAMEVAVYQEIIHEETLEIAEYQKTIEEQPLEIAEYQETIEEQPLEITEYQETVEEQPLEILKYQEVVEEQPLEIIEYQEIVEEQPLEVAEYQETFEQQALEISEYLETVEKQPLEITDYQEIHEEPVTAREDPIDILADSLSRDTTFELSENIQEQSLDQPFISTDTDKPKRKSKGAMIYWLVTALGVIIAANLIFGGFLWLNRETIMQNDTLRPWLTVICNVMECTLPPYHDPSKFSIQEHQLTHSSNNPTHYELHALIKNTAEYAQSLPQLQIGIDNLQGKRIETLMFRPRQYAKSHANKLIEPGETLHVIVSLQSKMPDIFSYELKFL